MSVRKRTWSTNGVDKEAWVVDYIDGQGKRRLKTFQKKKEADAFAATATVEVRQGMHVADSASVTVTVAGENWIAGSRASGLERGTLLQYQQHLDLHIAPFIGSVKLSQLNVPTVRSFEDKLREEGRSSSMVGKVLGSLGAILADAGERGLVARNVVRDLRGRRRKGKDRQAEGRRKGKLKIGVDIPTPTEISAILHSITGRWRPLIITAIFTGLRASELRGLRWEDVDLDARQLHVRQRADRYNDIGRPKSEAGERTVPLPPMALDTLREWKLACPKGDLGLVFPNGRGKVENLGNISKRGLCPVQIAAGVTVDTGKTDKDGKPVLRAKYTGMHALRHFYASWCINRLADGGMGLPPKVVQERLGHSTMAMTMDVYGHLFPRGDDSEEMAAAERALLATH
jgi:integrase